MLGDGSTVERDGPGAASSGVKQFHGPEPERRCKPGGVHRPPGQPVDQQAVGGPPTMEPNVGVMISGIAVHGQAPAHETFGFGLVGDHPAQAEEGGALVDVLVHGFGWLPVVEGGHQVEAFAFGSHPVLERALGVTDDVQPGDPVQVVLPLLRPGVELVTVDGFAQAHGRERPGVADDAGAPGFQGGHVGVFEVVVRAQDVQGRVEDDVVVGLVDGEVVGVDGHSGVLLGV